MFNHSKSFSISIETGINHYTAVFKRKYILKVESINNDHVCLRVTSVDFVPSGYRLGGSYREILDEQFSLNQISSKYDNEKKLLAALVLNHDTSLIHSSSIDKKHQSLSIIFNKLESILQKQIIEA